MRCRAQAQYMRTEADEAIKTVVSGVPDGDSYAHT
jgi:hypothetical protein